MANEDYQIIALANLQLEKHLTENPLTLEGAQRVKWDVEETEFHKIAKGTIRLPVEIYFTNPKDGEEPELRRVIIAGKRRFDARYDEVGKEQNGKSRSERIAALDETAARAESYTRYRTNMNMGH